MIEPALAEPPASEPRPRVRLPSDGSRPALPGPPIHPIRRALRYGLARAATHILVRAIVRVRVQGRQHLPAGPGPVLREPPELGRSVRPHGRPALDVRGCTSSGRRRRTWVPGAATGSCSGPGPRCPTSPARTTCSRRRDASSSSSPRGARWRSSRRAGSMPVNGSCCRSARVPRTSRCGRACRSCPWRSTERAGLPLGGGSVSGSGGRSRSRAGPLARRSTR